MKDQRTHGSRLGRVGRRWKLTIESVMLCVGVIVLASCERPMVQESEFQPTTGYQINGRIVDRFGVPVAGVEIYPYYDLAYASSDTAPAREYQVRDSITLVSMRVLDARDTVVRDLGSGFFAPGFILVEWDRRDDAGVDVPSGVYRVCYIVGDQIAGWYSVLVEGTLTARSDSLGAFTLWDHHLPMGFSPVPRYSRDSSVYYGLYSVAGVVILDLVTPSKIRTIGVRPVKDRVTNVPIVFD